MAKQFDYEVKTTIRLNMHNPDHVLINNVIQNLDPKIFKSKNQFILDACKFYIDNYGSSIEQREGRGIRQGNENEEVAIYRYVTKGTFDAYNWSLVENKQRFISQVRVSRGTLYQYP